MILNGVNAIDNISFSVKKGEVFGVLCGNGSGKSTLLQMLAGILQPDEGRIVVAPKIWFGAVKQLDTKDLIPKEWILI